MSKHAVAKISDFKESDRKIVAVGGMEVGIFYVDGRYVAWRNVCPHAAAPVCQGVVCGTRLPSKVYEYKYGKENEILRCPWHGWEFDLKTGSCLADPNVRLRGFPVELDGENICVLIN
jgi:nitrite reductase/ring-hydroxylating ferredoxin subunit